jgi:transcription initiation factor IIE alpha subunit
MTRETRHFIELSEILAFEQECPACHVRFSFELDRERRLSITCPTCNADLVGGEKDLEHLRTFIASLQYLRGRGTDLKGLRFQIEGLNTDDKS